MQKNIKIALIVIGCAVVIVLGSVLLSRGNGSAVSEGTTGNVVEEGVSKNNVTAGDPSMGNTQNPAQEENVPVEENRTLTPYERQLEALKTASLTKADMEESLGEGVKEKFKVFNMRITASGYIPNAIIVEKGDAVQLNISSDEDSDVESQDFNFFVPVRAKETTNLGFIANKEGTFAFYCRNQCLSADRIFGHIVVRPRS